MELEVNDMTCGHCASVITKAVKDVDAQAKVEIDIAARTVRIESTREASEFISVIRNEGYSPSVRA
jgi:copper chaperone